LKDFNTCLITKIKGGNILRASFTLKKRENTIRGGERVCLRFGGRGEEKGQCIPTMEFHHLVQGIDAHFSIEFG